MNGTSDLIDALRAEILNAAPAELPSLRGRLAELEAEIWLRLVTPAVVVHDDCDDRDDQLINVADAARRTGMSVRFMYKHAAEYGGHKHGGALRFSVKRLDRLIKRRSYNT